MADVKTKYAKALALYEQKQKSGTQGGTRKSSDVKTKYAKALALYDQKQRSQKQQAAPVDAKAKNAQIVAGARNALQTHQAENQQKWNSWQQNAAVPIADQQEIVMLPVAVEQAGYSDLATQAQREYEDYLASDEYKTAQQTRMQEYFANHRWDGLLNGLTGGSTVPSAASIRELTDTKAEELKAKAEYYKNMAEQEVNQKALDTALAELDTWSDADKQNLQTFISERSNSQITSLFGAQQFDSYVLNPIVQKYGIAKVRQMAEAYERKQNEEMAKQVEEASKAAADGGWGDAGHSVLSVGANTLGSMTGLIGRVQEAANRTGQFSTLQKYTPGDVLSLYGSTVRGQVAENITGDQYDGQGNLISDGGALRQGLATVYEAGMSAADNLARIFVSGGNEALSLGLAATGSFGQTVSQMSAQGANPVQAVAMGIVSGGLEVLTEKISLDNLFKQAAVGPKNLKAVLGGILKSGAIEVSEEELNFLCSTVMEAAIMQGKSGYNQQVQQLMMQGKSYQEAVDAADAALLGEAVSTAVQSFLSGGMMGGGAQVVSAYRTNQLGKDFEKLNLEKGDIQALVDSGLESNHDTESYKIAQEVQKKIEAGETPSSYELARLYQANAQSMAEEQEQTDSSTSLRSAQNDSAGAVQDVTQEQQNPRNPDAHVELAEEKKQPAAEQEPRTQQEQVRIGEKGTAMLASMIGVNNTREQFAEAKRLAEAYGVDIRLYTDYSVEKESYVEDGMIFLNTESDTDFESLVKGYANGQEGTDSSTSLRSAQNDSAGGVAAQLRQNQNLNGGNFNGSEATGSTAPESGAGVLHGSSQRYDGAGASEQAGSMAGRAGQTAQGQGVIDQRRATFDRRNRIGSLRLPKISSAELGISSGTDARNIQLVPREHWDAEMEQLAERVYQETGKSLSFVMGKIQIRGHDGRVRNVKGVITGDNIVIQGDNLRFTMEQIADHEAYHGRVDYFGDRLNQEIRQHIVSTFSEQEFRAVMEKYVEAMRGVYDTGDMLSGAEFEQLMKQIQEEVFADAYAGINAFGAGADRFTSAVNEKMEQLGLGRFRSEENGVRETAGPPSNTTGQKENTADYGGEKYSLDEYSEHQLENWASSKRIVVYKSPEQLARFIQDSIANKTMDKKMYFGTIPADLAERIRLDAGVNVENYNLSLGSYEIRKILKDHGNEERESPRGQRAIVENDFEHIVDVVLSPTKIALSENDYMGKPAIIFTGENNGRMNVVAVVSDKRLDLFVQTIFVNVNKKKGNLATPMDEQASINTPEANSGTVSSTESISDRGEIVKEKTAEHAYRLTGEESQTLGEAQVRRTDSGTAMLASMIGVNNTREQFAEVKRLAAEYGVDIRLYTDYSVEKESFVEDGMIFLNTESNTDFDSLVRKHVAGAKENTAGRSDEKYSVDEDTEDSETEAADAEAAKSDFEKIRAEMKGTRKSREEEFLRGKLGEERYAQYREWEKQQGEQRKQQRKQLKNETKGTSQPANAKRELRGTIMDMFSVPAEERAELGRMIDNFADRLLRREKITEEDRQAFFDRMYEAGVMTVPADDYFRMGRELVKGGKVYVPESVKADFGDDWNSFRARGFGAGIYFTSNPSDAGIDSWNHELASELPGMFDEDETDMRTILERIVDVAEEGRDEQMSLADYTAMLADRGDITEDEFLDKMERDLDEALRTFAKQAKLEVRLKDRSKYQIAKERQYHKEMQERQRERKQLREMQQKTLKTLQWLKKNRRRAPEEIQKKIDEVIGDLDIYAIHAAKSANWSEKYNATWEDIVAVYESSKASDPNFFESAELERMAGRLRGAKLGDMSIEMLEDLYRLAVGVQTTLQNRDRVLKDEHDRRIREVYRDSKDEIEKSGGKPSTNFIKKLFNDEQLTPMNILQRMAGWNPNSEFYAMMKQLEDGERAMRAHHVKAQRVLEKFMKEHQDYVKRADGQGKKGIWYEYEIPQLLALEVGKPPKFGENVKICMTSAQKVHLYLESKNQQNLRHIAGNKSGGGRTFVNKELYQKGDRQQAFSSGITVKMAPETVKKLVKDMTAEELELAGLLEQYYNTVAPEAINAVSNVLYGYDKTVGNNYAPIFTNSNFTESQFGVFDATAEGVGHMKERQQYASNPTYNISCFDAFERSVNQTARFVGMAIPIRNVKALLNTQGENNESMKHTITATWRQEGLQYIEDLMNTLQGNAPGEKKGKKLTVIDRAVGKLQSKYIQSTFGTNGSIVLKQVGSLPLASAYLGWKNAIPAPGLVHHTDRKLINQYTQDLAWRTMGYSMPETKMLKDNPNWTQTNKGYHFTFGGGAITAMDGAVAKVLWPWAENKVRRDFPDLEMGTQEQINNGESPFYKKVAEVFNDALARSQSTTDETHQSDLRKSDSAFTRMFTMFRSDSAQTYNALRQKIGEARYYDKEIKKRKDRIKEGKATDADRTALQELKKNRNKASAAVGNVVGAMVLNAMWSEVVTFAWALLRHKHKRYEDEDGELSWESVLEAMGNGMLGSMAGIVTGGEELFDIIGAFLTGDRWFGVESLAMEQLNTLIDTIMESGGIFQGVVADAIDVHQAGGNFWEYLGNHGRELRGGIKAIAETLAVYAGEIPVANVEAVLLGAVKWISPELGAAYDDLWQSIDKDDLTGLTGGALEGRISRILRDRSISEDDDTVEALAALYEAGHKSAVPGKIPTSVTVDGETKALDAALQNQYSEAWSGIVAGALDELIASDDFQNAEPEVQTKMISYLYDYAGEMTKAELFEGYEPNTRDEAVAAFAERGLGMDDFLIAYGKYNEIYHMDISNGEKADMFSHWVNEQGYTTVQAETVRDELVYYNMAPAEAKRYNEMVDNGLDSDFAYEVQTEMYKLDAEDAADVEYWRYAVKASSNEQMQMAIMGSTMSDDQFKKLTRAYSLDVSPDMFVTFYEKRSTFDADGNGSYTNAEVTALIESIGKGYTKEQKGVLWQMGTGSKSTKNNPYSQSAGQKWLDAKNADKEKG